MASLTAEQLNAQFRLDGPTRFQCGPGGLVELVMACRAGEARVFLHGAHVSHYQPAGGEPVLWMSESSWFEPGKPIRGGVPVCWPWFGPHPTREDAPSHGFARLLDWRVEAVEAGEDACRLELSLETDSAWQQLFDGQYRLRFAVSLGESLSMRLTSENHGDDVFTLCEALHSYFAVSDVKQVRVEGLDGANYLDKMAHARRCVQAGAIEFTEETDRVYVDADGPCELHDAGLGRTILVEKAGSLSTVVWNPWGEKSRRMPDFGDEEWPGMCCVETANAGDNVVTVPPGGEHTIEARISVR
jgi:D-hexose-6-phosphate mutarotase